MQAIVSRRRQLLGMLTAENNRLSLAPKAVAKRIKAHIRCGKAFCSACPHAIAPERKFITPSSSVESMIMVSGLPTSSDKIAWRKGSRYA